MFMCTIYFWYWIWKSEYCNRKYRCSCRGNVFLVHVQCEDLPSMCDIISSDVCLKIHWIEFLFMLCQLYMISVTKTQVAVWKEKILWKNIIFSQEQGLPIISSFDQQNLYLLTKLWPKQCRQHSISCPKYFIDYFTNYSFRHVADFASAWISNYFYFVIEGIALFKGKLESWTCFC